MADTSVYMDSEIGPVALVITNAALFGYYGFGMEGDPDVCFAKTGSNRIWTTGSQEGYNEIG